jgi:hypothetical protein
MIPHGAFTTNDFQMASALGSLGIPLVNHEGGIAQKGQCPEWREISTKDLEESGLSFEDAEKKGLGQIVYGFGNHDHRKETIDAFKKVMHAEKSAEPVEIPDVVEVNCPHCGKCGHVDVYKLLATGMAMFHRTAQYLWKRRKIVQALYRFRKPDGNDFLFNPRTTSPETLKLHGVE